MVHCEARVRRIDGLLLYFVLDGVISVGSGGIFEE